MGCVRVTRALWRSVLADELATIDICAGLTWPKVTTPEPDPFTIVRAVWAREKPLEPQGEHYRIPYRGAGAGGRSPSDADRTPLLANNIGDEA